MSKNDEHKHVSTLSAIQTGILYHSLEDPEESPNNIQFVIRLNELVKLPQLEKAWYLTLLRYDAMRSYYAKGNNEYCLAVNDTVKEKIPQVFFTWHF